MDLAVKQYFHTYLALLCAMNVGWKDILKHNTEANNIMETLNGAMVVNILLIFL